MDNYQLHFGAQSGILIGLLILLAGVILFLLFQLRRHWRHGEVTRSSLSFRILALVCLALVFAQPYREESVEKIRIPALIDISDSVDRSVGEELIERARALEREGIEIDVYPFAKRVGALALKPGTIESYEKLRDTWSGLDRGGTALADALQSSPLGGESQVLLFSDGYETQSNERALLGASQDQARKVFPFVSDKNQVQSGYFRISQLHVPLVAPQQTSVEIRVSVANTMSSEQQGVLEVKHDDISVYRETISLKSDSEIAIVAESDASKEGTREITATLTPLDRLQLASTETSYLAGEAREKVLLVSGNSDDERGIREALQQQAYKLDARTADRERPLDGLETYSSVILNNVPLAAIGRLGADKIKEFVTAGGGFIMIGGNKSFGLGGYEGTSIEEILPVELVPPRREEKRLNLALMLLLDKSRSMASNSKMDYAKEAARALVGSLKDEDYVGVIGFDASPFIVVRLSQVGTSRAQAIDRIGRIYPTGSTNPLPAIDEARRSLMRVNAGRKHILFLTDGEISDAGPHYIEMVKQMRLLGMTTSTVMLGSEGGDDFLRSMAEYGGGAYYQTNDARSLPKIFISDAKVRSGEQTLKEEGDLSVRAGPAGILSTSLSSFPSLRGYVQTKPRERANLELVTITQTAAEPLLASWKVGRGSVVAYTSDANGRWSREWLQWGRYFQFWSDVLDSIRPNTGESAERIPFDLRYYLDGSALTLDLAVFSEVAAGNVSAQVKLPNGTEERVVFQAVSRGRYRARIEQPLPGRYDIASQLGDRKLTRVSFALSGELFGEKKGRGFNTTLLQALAQESGGKINPTALDLKTEARKKVTRIDLSWIFLVIAFLALIAEIYRREIQRRRKATVIAIPRPAAQPRVRRAS